MVPPLNIYIVLFHKCIHNDIRMRTAVKNVADNVQAVDQQILNQITQGNDKIIPNTSFNNCFDNFIGIEGLIVFVSTVSM